jgi:hypothetical protein
MGTACDNYGEQQKCTHVFGEKNLKNVNRWDNNIKIDLRKHKMVCGLDASGP